MNGDLMYQEKNHGRIYSTDVLNKMGHVFERFRFLIRSRSLSQKDMETIDYHLTEIMKVLNNCN